MSMGLNICKLDTGIHTICIYIGRCELTRDFYLRHTQSATTTLSTLCVDKVVVDDCVLIRI